MIPFLDESGLAAIYDGESWRRIRAAYRAGAVVVAPPAAAVPKTIEPRANDGGEPGPIAIVNISGVITKGAGMFAELFGGTSVDALRATVAELRADRSVRGVVLRVDSPGGGVYGIDETAQAIAELAKVKPVVAFTDGMAASAAYWLIAGASRIVAAPSAEVGSIGVYAVHFDESGALAKEGITPTLIKAGAYKAEGNPFYPLSDEDRAAMQARIDTYYNLFARRVARGRGVAIDRVRNGFGEGRIVPAEQARREGMVTDIGSLTDAIRMALHPEEANAAAEVAALAELQTETAAALAAMEAKTAARGRAADAALRLRIAFEEAAG